MRGRREGYKVKDLKDTGLAEVGKRERKTKAPWEDQGLAKVGRRERKTKYGDWGGREMIRRTMSSRKDTNLHSPPQRLTRPPIPRPSLIHLLCKAREKSRTRPPLPAIQLHSCTA